MIMVDLIGLDGTQAKLYGDKIQLLNYESYGPSDSMGFLSTDNSIVWINPSACLAIRAERQ